MAQGTMSWIPTKSVRYFQGRKTGSVCRAYAESDARELELNPAMTEVQVVPLDAIVIRRDELPEVEERDEPSGPYLYAADVWAQDDGYETHMDRAIAQVAIAVYRQEHPPVDEAQVKALAELVGQYAGESNVGQYTLARRLVERGVRVGDA